MQHYSVLMLKEHFESEIKRVIILKKISYLP